VAAPASQIVALASGDLATAGCLTYWELAGPAERARLAASWEAADLNPDALPPPTSPEAALRLALATVRGRRRLARPISRGTWAVVDEEVVDDGASEHLDHHQVLGVRLNAVGRPEWFGDAVVHREAVARVTAAYDRCLDSLETEAVSGWLCGLVQRMGGVSLRDSGGFYFLPAGRTADWRRVAGAVEAATAHRVRRIPAMRTDETVQAVLAAIEAEAAEAADVMEAELVDESLGARALAGRARRCSDVEAKVRQYEELLGTGLDALAARLRKLRAGIAAAELVARAEAEAAA